MWVFNSLNPVLDFGKITPGSIVPAGVCPKCESLAYLATLQEIAEHELQSREGPERVEIVLKLTIPPTAKHRLAATCKGSLPASFYTPLKMANLFLNTRVYQLEPAPGVNECFKDWGIHTNIKMDTAVKVIKTASPPVETVDKQVITQDTDGSGLLKNPNDKELPPTGVATKEEVRDLIATLEKNIMERLGVALGSGAHHYAANMRNLIHTMAQHQASLPETPAPAPKEPAPTPRPTLREQAERWARNWNYRQGKRGTVAINEAPAVPEQFQPGDIIYAKGIFDNDPSHMFMIVKRATKKELTYFTGYFGNGDYIGCVGTLNVPATKNAVLDIGHRWFDVDLAATNGPFSQSILLHPERLDKYWKECTKALTASAVDKMRKDIARVAHHLCTCQRRLSDTGLIALHLKYTDPLVEGNTYVLPAKFFGLVVQKSAQGREPIAKKKKSIAAPKAVVVEPETKPYLLGEVLVHRDSKKIGIVSVNYADGNVEVTDSIRVSKGTVIALFKVFTRRSPAKQIYDTLEHVTLARKVKLQDKVILSPRKIAHYWERVTQGMPKGEIARLFELCKQTLHEVMFVRGRYTGSTPKAKRRMVEVAYGPACELPGQGHRRDLPVAFLTPIKVIKRAKR